MSTHTRENQVLVTPKKGDLEPHEINDSHSVMGRFGWDLVLDFPVPYIMRHNETRYCAKRIFKIIVLKYFPLVNNEVMHCIVIEAYNATKAETKLLNEINAQHCDHSFGELFAANDQICKLADLQEMATYLAFVMGVLEKPCKPITLASKCGFFRISNTDLVLPFVHLEEIYVPTFFIEGEMQLLQMKTRRISGWGLAYLKFCFKAFELNCFNYNSQYCEVVAFDEVSKYFPPYSYFGTMWPDNVKSERFLYNFN